MILGCCVTTLFCWVWYFAVIYTGAASYLSGSEAERWTGEALDTLDDDAWYKFHNVLFDDSFDGIRYRMDVDHVAVGAYGAIVLETKYSSKRLDLNAPQLDRVVLEAADQIERNAGRIRGLLQRDAPDVPVVPVVIYWGRFVEPPKGSRRRLGDVRLVHGGQANDWLALLASRVRVAPESVDRAASKIDSYIRQQEIRTHSR